VTHQFSDVRQYDTHGELIGRDDPSTGHAPARALDAIIVPASRPAVNLDHAITLARAAHSRLVVLCSRDANADDVNELLAARSFHRATVIDLPGEYDHPLLEFSTSWITRRLPGLGSDRAVDLSVKRNIGLLLARKLRWQRIFFMDDDIRDVHWSEVRRTVSMLGPYRSAGMRVTSFPDNSVVCHAHRETGKFQDVNISGSVLAVDCAVPVDFFPDIYNEDWLFFYHDAARRKLGCSGLNATQLRYDPFADPDRAVGQEFGDVLAEGLYALLHRGANATQASRDYWIRFLTARRTFLDAIIERCSQAPESLRIKIFEAVTAARDCSAQIAPELCEDYVTRWLQDRDCWQQRLSELAQAPSVEVALKELELTTADGGYGQESDFGQWECEMPPAVLPGPAVIGEVVTLFGQTDDDITLAAPPVRVAVDIAGTFCVMVAMAGAAAVGAVATMASMARITVLDAVGAVGAVSLMATVAAAAAIHGQGSVAVRRRSTLADARIVRARTVTTRIRRAIERGARTDLDSRPDPAGPLTPDPGITPPPTT